MYVYIMYIVRCNSITYSSGNNLTHCLIIKISSTGIILYYTAKLDKTTRIVFDVYNHRILTKTILRVSIIIQVFIYIYIYICMRLRRVTVVKNEINFNLNIYLIFNNKLIF
jgi:hypothetical protein